MMEGDEERKRESKRKREVWDLMRESMEFLRKNKEKSVERETRPVQYLCSALRPLGRLSLAEC